MFQQYKYWLPDEEKTRFCGRTLEKTLYGPTDVFLSGELGAGKTTFLGGFSAALGIIEALTSPTYALEQRYITTNGIEFIHSDFYRLTAKESGELLLQTDDHTGIRCIEWAERAETELKNGIRIFIEDAKEKEGRTLTVDFQDAVLPSTNQMQLWREEVALPSHIAAHCNAVADLCDALCDVLMERKYLVRKAALRKAAQLHDLFRFLDFQKGSAHHADCEQEEDPGVWEEWKKKFSSMHHEEACASFLQSKQFPILAEIVRVHGLQLPPPERQTIEQKLLYYADKRMMNTTKVSLEERFDDFMKRYGNGEWSDLGKKWYEEAKNVEEELFGGPCTL